MPFFSFNTIGHSSRVRLVLLSLIFFLGFAPWAYGATYYVDSGNGNDANAGTQQLPLKSISAAVSKAFAGDTILINSGTYREMIQLIRSGSDATHPIVLRANSGSNVQIKGSDLVTGWIKHTGSIWKKINWEVNSQQVFLDGTPLKQIGKNCPFNNMMWGDNVILPSNGNGIEDIAAGSFYYAPAEKILYIWLPDGSDPNSRQIEASVRNLILSANDVSYIELRFLNFSHSNVSSIPSMMGMVNIFGNSWLVTNCSFTYGDFAGLNIVGEGHNIINNISNYNGDLGISINGSDAAHNWAPYSNRPPQNILLEGNETSYNNSRGFYYLFQAGGVKATNSCNGVTISQHKANANNGHGIWFDGFCQNSAINRGIIQKNIRGIEYEISYKALITNNLIVDNSDFGIYISASDEVSIVNNTLVNNENGIKVHGLPRQEHPSLKNNNIRNNIISDSKQFDLVLYNNGNNANGNTSDYNLYFRQNTNTLSFSWNDDSGYNVNYTDLRTFSINSGQEVHSISSNPLLRDVVSGNYSLTGNSPAIDSGTLQVYGVGDKDLLGNSRILDGKRTGNNIIDIGAYEYNTNSGISAPKSLRITN